MALNLRINHTCFLDPKSLEEIPNHSEDTHHNYAQNEDEIQKNERVEQIPVQSTLIRRIRLKINSSIYGFRINTKTKIIITKYQEN